MKFARSIFQNPDHFILLILPLVILCFFWNLTGFEFLNLDDPGYVTENPWVLRGLNLQAMHWAFTTAHMGHWHPLTWISHMIDVSIFGLDPWGHHFVNLLFHSINASLVFLLLRRLSFSVETALFAALFFSLHPMRLESVAWVSERKDMLSFCFGLLALLVFLSEKLKSRSEWIRVGGALFFFILSLLCKPTFVSLPLLICLIDFHLSKPTNPKTFVVNKIPFFILAGAVCVQAIFTQAAAGALKSASLSERISEAIVSIGAYAGKFFFPLETGIFYPREVYPPGLAAGMFIGLIMTTYVCFQFRKTKPLVWLGWLWFLLSTLPESGLVPIGGQAFADRWTLLPHIGLLISMASFFSERISFLSWKAAIGLSAVIFVATLTLVQMPYWHDSESIFRQTLRVSPHNFLAHNNLGYALDKKNRLDEAAANYQEAIRDNPNYAEAINSFGSIQARRGNLEEAVALFKRALELNPSLVMARSNLEQAMRFRGK